MALDLNHPDLLTIERQLCGSNPDIVFFVGAGLSRQSGFPLWHELLRSLIEFGRTVQRMSDAEAHSAYQLIEQGQYLECGSILRKQLGERLTERLHDIFSRKTIEDPGPYRYLVRIPCAGFVTTNYDGLIEHSYAASSRAPMVPVLPQIPTMLGSITERKPFLLKLHGDAEVRTFVLSSEDYALLKSNAKLQRFLYTMFYHYKLVFLGYGLSDDDVLSPLSLLSEDYQGTSHRHLAIMPDSIGDALRRKLEDSYGINIVLYSSRNGHQDVERVLLRWLAAREDATKERLLLTRPRDCTDLLTKHPSFMARCVRKAAQQASAWLRSIEPNWGRAPGTPARAATLAEVLIAFNAASHVLSEQIDFKRAANALLGFQDSNGGTISASLAAPTTHTTALSAYALSLYQHIDSAIVSACQRNCDWLLSQIQPQTGAWGTFAHSEQTRIVPSVWAYIGLCQNDRFPDEHWRTFAARLNSLGSIGFSFDHQGKSVAAAAWTLFLLSLLKQRNSWTENEEALLEICLKQLNARNEALLSENEGFPMEEANSATEGIWIRWVHPSAAAVALACIPWLDSHKELWKALGSSVSYLMEQSSHGLDGHLRDSASDPDSSASVVFPTAYGLWAFCNVIQLISGSLIDKIGLLTIRNGKVLLLRKRGGALLIVPGGRREHGESMEEALHREISEELQTKPVASRYWKVFEDTAAFERGATVRITAFFGDLEGEPQAAAEISGMVWAGADYPRDLLSPIVRNHIFPELIKMGLIH